MLTLIVFCSLNRYVLITAKPTQMRCSAQRCAIRSALAWPP
jgi:hypothetical protein